MSSLDYLRIGFSVYFCGYLLWLIVSFIASAESRARYRAVVSRFRFRHLATVALMFIAVIGVARVLYLTFPVLQLSIVTAVLSAFGYDLTHWLSGELLGERSQFENLLSRAVLTLLAIYFVLRLPDLALREEKAFRSNCQNWYGIISSSIVFGPAHCIGVPILPFCAGIAISAGGMILALQYRKIYRSLRCKLSHGRANKEAVLECTAIHFAYNFLLLSFLFVSVQLKWWL